MIQAYLFDLDGTLIDTETIWVEALQAFLNARGHDFSYAQAEALVFGRSWHDIYDDVIRTYHDLEMDIREMEQEIAPFFRQLSSERDVRIHNSIDLLRALSTHTPTCIVSGSTRETIERAIYDLDIENCLQFFLGAEDYSPGKPDPACYRLAAEKLQAEPERCVVFEDSAAGVLSAKANGMLCVALRRSGAPDQDVSAADLVLDDLADFDAEMLGL